MNNQHRILKEHFGLKNNSNTALSTLGNSFLDGAMTPDEYNLAIAERTSKISEVTGMEVCELTDTLPDEFPCPPTLMYNTGGNPWQVAEFSTLFGNPKPDSINPASINDVAPPVLTDEDRAALAMALETGLR